MGRYWLVLKLMGIGLFAILGVHILGLLANLSFALSYSSNDVLPANSSILVLGGPRLQQRLETGVAAYHTYGAKFFVVSSDRVANVIADRAEERGVPREIILLESRARSTLQNALFVREILTDTDSPIVIVTQRAHLLRASASFRWAGFQDIYLLPADQPSDYLGKHGALFLTELVKWDVNVVRAGIASFLDAVGWTLEDYRHLLI